MSSFEKILLARCPAEVAGSDDATDHLAVNIRLPLPMGDISALLSKLAKCPCGQKMILLTDKTRDPWASTSRSEQ